MPVTAIDTDADVADDRVLRLQLPPAIPDGHYRVIVILDERASAVPESGAVEASGSWQFPVLDDAGWPNDMPLRREEM